MNILAIVKNSSNNLFCMITWIGKARENKPLTRMWVSDGMANTCTGDTIEEMEIEIEYLVRQGWERVV